MLLSSIAVFLFAAILLVGYPPLLVTAQQTGTTITTTTIPPLTPEEQEEQNRLQNVIAATNQNLDEAEKEVNGIVYNPRWSDVVWVEPDSLSILIAYCLPGEFAESGQEILGGFELEVLESYEVALAQGFMAWMMVVGNEDRQDRLPAAVGVICASDTNDVETRVLSPQEQQEINNIVQQFTTQVTNIEQVVNIINNITTTPTQNGTGGTTPPPPTTGNGTGGGGGGGPFRPIIPDIVGNITVAEADRTSPVVNVPAGYPPIETNSPQGAQGNYGVDACDNVDGAAALTYDNILIQDSESDNEQFCGLPIQDPIGGDITISCNPPSGSIFPIGFTTVQCIAVDASGNTGTASFTIRVRLPLTAEEPLVEEQQQLTAAEEEAPVEEEQQQPPAAEEEAPVQEEQAPPAAEGDEGATSPPANGEGGG